MKDQHEKIKGYRDLTQEEIDLMNQVKLHAEVCGAMIDRMDKMPNPMLDHPQGLPPVMIDKRWLSIARTQLQQGYMALVRSITRPTSF